MIPSWTVTKAFLLNGKSEFLFNHFCRSREAGELRKLVQTLGQVADLCAEEYILDFFKELNLSSKHINFICPTTAKFTSLKVLNLSFNTISRIENLPSTLEELYLNGNQVD